MQAAQDYNNKFTTEMTEWLFPAKGKDFGLDIVALNIQRGRDHQIQGYVAYKSVGFFSLHYEPFTKKQDFNVVIKTRAQLKARDT